MTQNTDAGIVHHVQVEPQPFATSPIVTGASPVTRAADAASVAVGPWLNAAAGTLLVEAQTPSTAGTTAFFVSDGCRAHAFQLDELKFHGRRSSIWLLGCPAAMASRVALR